MIIAVDAAGGEYAPREIVEGAIKAIEEYKVDVALVGRKTILQMLARRHLKKPGLTIIEANEVIEYRESPIKAIRSKPDPSTVVGIHLVRDGADEDSVSAGNTGAVLAAGRVCRAGETNRIEDTHAETANSNRIR